MLPDLGTRLLRLPPLEYVRDLEEFEGPLLTELRGPGSNVFVEKWCSCDAEFDRTLLVNSDQRTIAEFLAQRVSMLHVLTVPNSDIGILLDYRDGEAQRGSLVEVSSLPGDYLPGPMAMHNPKLRPRSAVVRQDFLFDSEWSTGELQRVEHAYLKVYGFEFAAANGPEKIETAIANRDFKSGWDYYDTFSEMWRAVPRALQARTVAVRAASPGILSMEAPREIAARVFRALHLAAKDDAAKAYRKLHDWSRLKVEKAGDVEAEVAVTDITELCKRLGLDPWLLLQPLARWDASTTRDGNAPKDPFEGQRLLLMAGKVLAAYYRRLVELLELGEGIELLLDGTLAEDAGVELEDG